MLHQTPRVRYAAWVAMAAVLGFGLGRLASPSLSAQPSMILNASDSATALSVAVQTNGTNALKVLGK